MNADRNKRKDNPKIDPNPSGNMEKQPEDWVSGHDPTGKRETIDTGRDKRYVSRDQQGQFKESTDVGRSLSQDVKRNAETVVKPGYGDKGDQKRK